MAIKSSVITQKAKKSSLGTPPTPEDNSTKNLNRHSSTKKVKFSMDVPIEWRRELKAYAANRDMDRSEVLMEGYEMYRQKYPV